MKTAVVYIHGQGGHPSESEHYQPLFPDSTIVGLAYHGTTPWEAGQEIHTAIEKLSADYDRIFLIANSIGALFSMYAEVSERIQAAWFISPIVDMDKLIQDRMTAEGITAEALEHQSTIPTPDGVLSWSYWRYVREHPVKWTVPTEMLYGSHDTLTAYETITAFAAQHNARLTVMDDGEHWFHTAEQMRFLDDWIASTAIRRGWYSPPLKNS